MDISIVPVEQKYIPKLIKLIQKYFDFYKVESPSVSKIEKLVRELMEDTNPSTQFLAKVDSSLVGFVTLYEIYSTLSAGKLILMNDLFVKPDYRGKGIGKELFQFAQNYTQKQGYHKMEWMTEPDNHKARGFYDSQGGIGAEWIYYSIKVDKR